MEVRKTKKQLYVVVPKHSSKPSFVCTHMKTACKELGDVHPMTLRIQIKAKGFYCGDGGSLYPTPLLKAIRNENGNKAHFKKGEKVKGKTKSPTPPSWLHNFDEQSEQD